MATERQLEANRRNAKKSTGPRTVEGKETSRANAYKHGLTGAGVVLSEREAEEIDQTEAEWYSSLKPANAFEVHLARRIAVDSVREEHCERDERALRARLADRASVCWEADRRLDAAKLGAALGRHPEVIAGELERSPQGCDWLRARWERLGRTLDLRGAWTDAQTALALDLLGTSHDLRDMPGRLDPAPGGDALETLRAVVRDEVARLSGWQAALRPLDDQERAAAARGTPTGLDPALANLRRYEAACHRRKAWALKQFKNGRHDYTPAPVPQYRVDDSTVGDPWSSTAYRTPPPPAPAPLTAQAVEPEPEPAPEPEAAPELEPVHEPRAAEIALPLDPPVTPFGGIEPASLSPNLSFGLAAPPSAVGCC